MSTAKLLSDRYELGETLGYGGMSEVHLGRDIRLGREVAIKILRADLASDTVFQERFRREAQNSAALSHPAIVAVYDTGETGDEFGSLPYIVMEYVEGRTLRDLVKTEGPMDPKRAMEVMADVCAALDFSHRHGIVHRDVKPANVMISKSGAVKVMDFGIARAIHDGQATMTQTAAVIGTAQYLSPEQAQGHSVDARSDVYAAGCVLYELITGEPPFTGDSPVAVAYQHVREDPDPPSAINPAVSPELDAVVLKALAKGPANRYQSAAEMRSDLVRVLSDQRPNAPMVMTDDERTQLIAARPVVPTEEQEADEAEQRRRRRKRFLIGAAVIVGAALIGLLWLLNPFAGETIEKVPNIQGQTIQSADTTLRDIGFTNVDREEVVCKPTEMEGRPACDAEKYGDGKVFAVDPEIGTRIALNDPIKLQYGKQPREFELPSLRNQERVKAEKTAKDAQLFVKIAPEKVPNKDINRAGRVAQQSPAAGKTVAEGDTVTLKLYESPETVRVKDYTGEPLDVAKAGLEGAGLEVVSNPVDSDEDKDTVVKQDPSGGDVVKGSTVTLDVSNGSDVELEMPDLVGLASADDAKKRLIDVGHSGEFDREWVDTRDRAEDGVVMRTDPEAGTTIRHSDRPTLFVARFRPEPPPPTTTTEEDPPDETTEPTDEPDDPTETTTTTRGRAIGPN